MILHNFPWLNEEFLHSILRKDFDIPKEKVPIVDSFRCELASKTGENYSSILYRLTIDFRLPEDDVLLKKSYIVKCMHPPDTNMGKLLKEFGLYQREAVMYGETLTLIDNAIKSIGTELELTPKCLHIVREPIEILVIEDLQPQGFKNVDRLVGLDYEHCKMVFGKLAKMHAATMYLNKENPQFRSEYNEGGFKENTPETMTTYFKNGVLQATEVMRQQPSLQKYVKTYESYAEHMMERGIELFKTVPENVHKFNVLNQGDLWLNNIMFKYNDSGEPVDVRFVDFQMCTFGCPGVDINYFFFTSPMEETRSAHRDDLLALYQSALAETLEKLKYDAHIPTLDDLYEELLRSKDIGLMTVCIVLPLVKLNKESSDTMTPDNIMNEDSASSSRQSLYNNNLYTDALEVALDYLEKIKFIEL